MVSLNYITKRNIEIRKIDNIFSANISEASFIRTLALSKLVLFSQITNFHLFFFNKKKLFILDKCIYLHCDDHLYLLRLKEKHQVLQTIDT